MGLVSRSWAQETWGPATPQRLAQQMAQARARLGLELEQVRSTLPDVER